MMSHGPPIMGDCQCIPPASWILRKLAGTSVYFPVNKDVASLSPTAEDLLVFQEGQRTCHNHLGNMFYTCY
ncbi:Uncharacterized protein HZ326_15509 [Fusarium oxysporum f. sp. albedinis]|nr:Uncharacterized protein HZ326_15509 [Fusarium oxysporum f. sp. albedinis]